MKKYYLFMFFLLIIPFKLVLADTWLDDPSYRDTSWFNESTYATTEEYTMDTPKKLAGLLYLVNENSVTFENKKIYIVADSEEDFCGDYHSKCVLDMTAHDWVPLKSYFAGVFYYTYFYYDDVFDMNLPDYSDYIYTRSINKEINLVETGTCRTNFDYTGAVTTQGFKECTVHRKEEKYSIYLDIEGEGTVDLPEYATFINLESYGSVEIKVTVNANKGYYFHSITAAKDEELTNTIETKRTNINEYTIRVNKEKTYIKTIFKEKGNTKCKAITGNGKNIGDEVACGTEHFYVLSNDNNEIRMLSKYNLYTGISIHKEKIEKEDDDTRTDEQYCQDLATSKGGMVKRDDFYNIPGYCFYTLNIETEHLLQNKDAISAHWDEDGNYLYPQVGDVYLYSPSSSRIVIENEKKESDEILFGDFEINWNVESVLSNNLVLYKKELEMLGITVNAIDLLSISELDETINRISNKRLPLIDWSNQSRTNMGSLAEFGEIKSYIPKEYSWLYSTTYWLKTILYSYYMNNGYSFIASYYTFVYTDGKLCGAGFDYCVTTTKIGTGIRPIVVIPNELLYKINKKITGKGMIEVEDEAVGNSQIYIKVTPKEGYKLNKIIIKNDNDEQVELDVGETITNSDGTISFDKGQFTMPFENVTIEAEFISAYRFIEGNDQEFNISKDSDMRFKVNMEYEDFIDGGKIFIDNKEIDCNCYVVSEGSTVITFKDECTKDFKTGKHEIVAMLKDGNSARTDFTIKKDLMDIIDDIPIVREIINPETSDKIFLVIILLFGSWLLFNYSKANKTNKYRI